MSQSNPRYRRREPIEVSSAGDRVILYHRETGKALVLNPTGSRLWQALETPRSADELASQIQAHYPSLSLRQAAQDVKAYLNELVSHDAVSVET